MGYITRLSALVAQRIEQLPSKQWVVGSIPARGAIFLASKIADFCGFLCCISIGFVMVICGFLRIKSSQKVAK